MRPSLAFLLLASNLNVDLSLALKGKVGKGLGLGVKRDQSSSPIGKIGKKGSSNIGGGIVILLIFKYNNAEHASYHGIIRSLF